MTRNERLMSLSRTRLKYAKYMRMHLDLVSPYLRMFKLSGVSK